MSPLCAFAWLGVSARQAAWASWAVLGRIGVSLQGPGDRNSMHIEPYRNSRGQIRFTRKDETCQPSENLAPVLAAGDDADAAGRDLLVVLAPSPIRFGAACRAPRNFLAASVSAFSSRR